MLHRTSGALWCELLFEAVDLQSLLPYDEEFPPDGAGRIKQSTMDCEGSR
jgi:hypothetical protein